MRGSQCEEAKVVATNQVVRAKVGVIATRIKHVDKKIVVEIVGYPKLELKLTSLNNDNKRPWLTIELFDVQSRPKAIEAV